MGIPHLITHLRPYSKNTNFNGLDVIIDGPGFAYHIFHACLANEPDARNPFEAFPSYGKVGDAAIRWLEELEGFGVEVYRPLLTRKDTKNADFHAERKYTLMGFCLPPNRRRGRHGS